MPETAHRGGERSVADQLNVKAKKTAALSQRWNTAVNDVLVRARKNAGVSQQQLADMLGWSRAKVAYLETGQGTYGFDDVMVIVSALKADRERICRLIIRTFEA
jgi:ribosome-binding protein aMBF1 (putative translation factor)